MIYQAHSHHTWDHASTTEQVSPILRDSTIPSSTQIFLVDFGLNKRIPAL